MSRRRWPSWWKWELELSPHVLKRMIDRDFTEVDLRRMFQKASALHRDVLPGRWAIETKHRKRAWEVVIVEPDPTSRILVVVTAYPIWES